MKSSTNIPTLTASQRRLLRQVLDYYYFARDLLTGCRTKGEISAAQVRERDTSQFLDYGSQLRILDIGCGLLRPQLLVLSGQGHKVIGVDLINRSTGTLSHKLYAIARLFFRLHLPAAPRATAPHLVCADAGRLPFPNNHFDLISSVAAFEHFLNVPSVLDELNRTLRPSGVIWVIVHLFTSLSGGHNVGRQLSAIQSFPSGIEPWDHLRRQQIPFTVPLNKWRLKDYLQAFADRFEIVKHYCVGVEGRHLLTPEIQNELSDYTEEELTSASYIIVARKRP